MAEVPTARERGEVVGLHESRAGEHGAAQAGAMDRGAGPSRLSGLAVIDAPAINARSGSAVNFFRDHQELKGGLALFGQVQDMLIRVKDPGGEGDDRSAGRAVQNQPNGFGHAVMEESARMEGPERPRGREDAGFVRSHRRIVVGGGRGGKRGAQKAPRGREDPAPRQSVVFFRGPAPEAHAGALPRQLLDRRFTSSMSSDLAALSAWPSSLPSCDPSSWPSWQLSSPSEFS